MRLVKTLPILLGLGAALGSVSAWALPNDSQQPIHISADDAQLDDKQGVATYTGGVIITQGSMKITGNTVTLTRTPAGDIDVVTSVGNLAYFEQKQAAADPAPMKGYGRTIQYHAQQNRIILIDQARVVSTDGNTTEGEKSPTTPSSRSLPPVAPMAQKSAHRSRASTWLSSRSRKTLPPLRQNPLRRRRTDGNPESPASGQSL